MIQNVDGFQTTGIKIALASEIARQGLEADLVRLADDTAMDVGLVRASLTAQLRVQVNGYANFTLNRLHRPRQAVP